MTIRIFLIITALAACAVDPAPSDTGLPTTPECGTYPSHGNYSVRYEYRNDEKFAVLSATDFDGLVSERVDAKQWAYCVTATK